MQPTILGTILALLFMVPMVLTLIYFPENFPPDFKPLHPIFWWLEHIGFFGAAVAMAYSESFFATAKFNLAFVLMIICYCAYIGLWFRYYNEGQDILLLYESFFKVPIPVHIFSVLFVFFCCIWSADAWVGIMGVFYAIGSLPNAWHNYNQVK